MITRPVELIGADGAPVKEGLRSVIDEHLSGLTRLERLGAYYAGRHPIDGRLRASGLPNARLNHGFPRYISTVVTGYLLGHPVRYRSDDTAFEGVKDALEACAADSVDVELARNASIFGRGVELVFAGEDARPRTASIDPREGFVVYDDTVAHVPLMGVRLRQRLRPDGSTDGWAAEVYTKENVFEYAAGFANGFTTPLKSARHYFSDVPMVEYWNSEDEKGDFEDVLTLIDAYDALESDRINDKAQFVDALLLLYGCTMETDEHGRTPGQQLREDKALVLPDSDARAEWLCKQLNEADTEVLKRALAADIHKLSMVPDLADERFASEASGVAMRFKLLGLEQLARVKERWFREALRARLALFSNYLALRGAPAPDVRKVGMTFTRALPVDAYESARTLNELRGLADEQSLKAHAEEITLGEA